MINKDTNSQIEAGPPSWGLYPKSTSKSIPIDPKKPYLPQKDNNPEYSALPYGLGRSYGDSCLNNGHILCPTDFLDMLLDLNIDSEGALLRAQAGASLKDILNVIIPKGWFIPVSPGTKYVTLGGAIANDIHGKNHHKQGCFGNHLKEIKVTRTNREIVIATPSSNDDFFSATVGGLGLTGLITEATISLKKIESSQIEATHTPFESLDEFFSINQEKEKTNEYTVAWLDTLSPRGKGIYIAGDHAKDGDLRYNNAPSPKISVPIEAPNFILNPVSIKLFNELYYLIQKRKKNTFKTSINSFFYPLDGVGNWNKLYGKRGFFQYQCVIPEINEESKNACLELLKNISESRQGSFLAVLKTFGNIKSKGILSFPKKGITIALEFPNNGEKTKQLFKRLDKIVREARGRLYPAKDAHMTPTDFKTFYPDWGKMLKYKDPGISSSFWRRVTEIKPQ